MWNFIKSDLCKILYGVSYVRYCIFIKSDVKYRYSLWNII